MTIEQLVSCINSLPIPEKRKLLALLTGDIDVPSREGLPEIGWAKDLITIRADFDDPLSEFEDVTL
jgi:hypothetical protein